VRAKASWRHGGGEGGKEKGEERERGGRLGLVHVWLYVWLCVCVFVSVCACVCVGGGGTGAGDEVAYNSEILMRSSGTS
jgi:hypothetical protein